MVLTGCRDFMTCILACHSVVDLLRNRLPGFFLDVMNIQMQNIVGHVDLHLNDKILDLDRFYRDNNIECTFQRTMFPGLVYRAADSSVVMLIFASGRVVVTGAKSTVSVELAWHALRTKLLSYTINKEA
jgi:transcription initiation factor TFIID TATA-box-binding protein